MRAYLVRTYLHLYLVSFALLLVTILGDGRSFAAHAAEPPAPEEGFVAILPMQMAIMPGTDAYLKHVIEEFGTGPQAAKLIVIQLNTPGGLLDSAQHMIQSIFNSHVPVVIYVGPSGSTAASAGVFITLAGHVAVMAPGTSIGAAHPVSGDGKNLESDMRAKAENITIAMVKSISQERGRNVEWAEKSVRESSSLTETEALKASVVDFVAEDLDDLLKQVRGRKVKLPGGEITLGDYQKLPRRVIEIGTREKVINVLADPNVAALLWLAATTGISIELYNPGAILPGVVGVISLILALAVGQIIPFNQGAILLFVVGALLLGAEMYVPSGILGAGGVLAMVIGAMYLVDVSQAPGLGVDLTIILPIAILFGASLLLIVTRANKALRSKVTTGIEGLVGQEGVATEQISSHGRVFVNGELWNAESGEGLIEKDSKIEVLGVREGMRLSVKKI